MEKEFVTHEQAVALKKLGFCEDFVGYFFDERCREFGADVIREYQIKTNSYDVRYTPLKSHVFRWFREKYGLIGWIEGKRVYRYCIESPIPGDGQLNLSPFKTYEEAENACIDKLIELVKQQKDGKI